MADIVAANVTAQIISAVDFPSYTAGGGGNTIKRRVVARITIATNTDFPANGIPLTNLFTTNDASDTKLDVTRPIWARSGPLKTSAIAAGTFSAPTQFSNGGTTAATQTLLVLVANQAGTDNFPKVAANSQNLNAANFTLGSPPYICDIEFEGDRRIGTNT